MRKHSSFLPEQEYASIHRLPVQFSAIVVVPVISETKDRKLHRSTKCLNTRRILNRSYKFESQVIIQLIYLSKRLYKNTLLIRMSTHLFIRKIHLYGGTMIFIIADTNLPKLHIGNTNQDQKK
jgi:hypothetical protein